MRLLSALLLAVSFAAEARTFSLMAYNAENLFDTVHDPGKRDYTYLPLKVKNASSEIQQKCKSIENDFYRELCLTLDWNRSVLDNKIQNLAKVILSYNGGRGPDILILEEVENERVLSLLGRKLRRQGLRWMSLREGPDERGVDVAIVSRFPIINEKLHVVDLEGVAKKTRGILQADIAVGSRKVSVFANHWPSQSNPPRARLIAAQTLVQAALASDADFIVAGGDFNTKKEDDPNGINIVVRPHFWLAEEKAKESGFDPGRGSHWYKGEWTFLDKIMVAKNPKSPVKPLFSAFKAYRRPWMMKELVWNDDAGESQKDVVPARYDSETGEGYSDHLPLVMRFSY